MNTRRILSCLLLPVYLSSCTSWQVQPVSPEQVVTEEEPSRIRVTLADSSEVEMEQPRIVGDTLRGMVKGPPPTDAQQGAEYVITERDVLLADIATVRVRKANVGKTLIGAVGITIALVIAAAALVSEVEALSDTTGGT